MNERERRELLQETLEFLRQRLERERQSDDMLREILYETQVRLRAEVLVAKGLLTSRRILEYILEIAFIELNMKGHFNASATCNHIANNFIGTATIQNILTTKCMLTLQIYCFEALKSSFSLYFTRSLLNAIDSCGCKPECLVELYAELSSEIHETPWSGPGVLVEADRLKDGATGTSACLIKSIASYFISL